MKIKNQEGDTSLIGMDCRKTPNGVFPEIGEKLKGLAVGRVHSFLKFFCYSTGSLDRRGRVWLMTSLERVGRNPYKKQVNIIDNK